MKELLQKMSNLNFLVSWTDDIVWEKRISKVQYVIQTKSWSNEHYLITYVPYVTYVLSKSLISSKGAFYPPSHTVYHQVTSLSFINNCCILKMSVLFYANQIISWFTLTMFNSLQIWQSAVYTYILQFRLCVIRVHISTQKVRNVTEKNIDRTHLCAIVEE